MLGLGNNNNIELNITTLPILLFCRQRIREEKERKKRKRKGKKIDSLISHSTGNPKILVVPDAKEHPTQSSTPEAKRTEHLPLQHYLHLRPFHQLHSLPFLPFIMYITSFS